MPWWALLGIEPLSQATGLILTPHDAGRVLDGVYSLGALTLRPGDKQLVDYVTNPDLGIAELVSWPIVIEGDSNPSNPVYERVSAALLHRLCTLLSLAWGEPWQVRVAPRSPDAFAPHVPDPILVPDSSFPRSHNPQIGMRSPKALPLWLQLAWTAIDNQTVREEIVAALSFWHQGILLMPKHPSFAFLGFIGAVERLAPKSVTGHPFWTSLDTVASPEEMRMLRKAKVYDVRSAIAHGGALHGIEREFGRRVYLPISSEDRTEKFMFSTLVLMGRLSRTLLLRSLGAETDE